MGRPRLLRIQSSATCCVWTLPPPKFLPDLLYSLASSDTDSMVGHCSLRAQIRRRGAVVLHDTYDTSLSCRECNILHCNIFRLKNRWIQRTMHQYWLSFSRSRTLPNDQ